MNNKDMLDLIKQVERKGWPVERLNSGHYRVRPPNGQRMIVTTGNANDWRAHHNFRADLRRVGFYEPSPDDDARDAPKLRAIIALTTTSPTASQDSTEKMIAMIKLGRKMARIPADAEFLGTIVSVMEDAEKLGLSMADVRGLLESIALESA